MRLLALMLLPSLCFAMPVERQGNNLKPMIPIKHDKSDAYMSAHPGVTCYHIHDEIFECADGHKIEEEK